MSWRISKALENLRDSVNELYPDRFKGTDGSISGYPGAKSSHNVNSLGVVNAYDFSVGDYPNGINHEQALELTDRIKNKLHLIGGESYVIYEQRIADGYTQEWRPYVGPFHGNHFHVSTDKDYFMGSTPSGLTNYGLDIDWELNGMALSEDDINRIFDKRFDKIGGGDISLREFLMYSDANTGWVVNEIRSIFTKPFKRLGGKRAGTFTTFGEQIQWADANQESLETKFNSVKGK